MVFSFQWVTYKGCHYLMKASSIEFENCAQLLNNVLFNISILISTLTLITHVTFWLSKFNRTVENYFARYYITVTIKVLKDSLHRIIHSSTVVFVGSNRCILWLQWFSRQASNYVFYPRCDNWRRGISSTKYKLCENLENSKQW